MKKPEKSTVEAVKTIVIAVLVTGILAFIGGAKYANSISAHVNHEVKAATTQQVVTDKTEPTQGK